MCQFIFHRACSLCVRVCFTKEVSRYKLTHEVKCENMTSKGKKTKMGLGDWKNIERGYSQYRKVLHKREGGGSGALSRL